MLQHQLRCNLCGQEIKAGAGAMPHLRTAHNVGVGEKLDQHRDKFEVLRTIQVANPHRKKRAVANGNGSEPVEVSSNGYTRTQPCPSCGLMYKIPYLYAHMRNEHGIFGGKTGVKRMDDIQRHIAKTKAEKSQALVPVTAQQPEPEPEYDENGPPTITVMKRMQVVADDRGRIGIVEWQD
jgi:hypothetical protein